MHYKCTSRDHFWYFVQFYFVIFLYLPCNVLCNYWNIAIFVIYLFIYLFVSNRFLFNLFFVWRANRLTSVTSISLLLFFFIFINWFIFNLRVFILWISIIVRPKFLVIFFIGLTVLFDHCWLICPVYFQRLVCLGDLSLLILWPSYHCCNSPIEVFSFSIYQKIKDHKKLRRDFGSNPQPPDPMATALPQLEIRLLEWHWLE